MMKHDILKSRFNLHENSRLKLCNYMKTTFKSFIKTAVYSFSGVLCGSILLMASSAQAQNLFEAYDGSGIIYEYTPGGVQSTFASGLDQSHDLAFNSAGDLFVSTADNIYEYTPGGTQSTFATGVSTPYGLAFNSAGDLFVGSQGSDDIYEYTPGGTRSTFASGVEDPFGLAFNSAGDLFAVADGGIYEYTPGGVQSTFFSGDGSEGENVGLAFQGVTLPVPEPSAFALLGLGAMALLARRRK
jgi:hypothetical protein